MWSDHSRSSVTLCSAKNSGVVRLSVISQAVALAPFSQNSKGWGSAGLAHEQLTHMKPSGLFCFIRTSGPRSGISSWVNMLASATTDPHPPAALGGPSCSALRDGLLASDDIVATSWE